MGGPCPEVSNNELHLYVSLMLLEIDVLTRSTGIWDGIVNSIYGCGVKITPDINPIYYGLERSCPRDSKIVSRLV